MATVEKGADAEKTHRQVLERRAHSKTRVHSLYLHYVMQYNV